MLLFVFIVEKSMQLIIVLNYDSKFYYRAIIHNFDCFSKKVSKMIKKDCIQGTLINKTFETFDYMEDIVDVLNELPMKIFQIGYGKCRDCKIC